MRNPAVKAIPQPQDITLIQKHFGVMIKTWPGYAPLVRYAVPGVLTLGWLAYPALTDNFRESIGLGPAPKDVFVQEHQTEKVQGAGIH